MLPTCKHCVQYPANRPRGLCWRCYYTPGVLELYPSTSKFARRGVGLAGVKGELPDAPTAALPGTEEKVAVLCERVRLRQSLFHHGDVADPLGELSERLPDRSVARFGRPSRRRDGIVQPSGDKWRAVLYLDAGARKHLGTFPTREEAEAVLTRKAAELGRLVARKEGCADGQAGATAPPA